MVQECDATKVDQCDTAGNKILKQNTINFPLGNKV